MTVEQHRIVVKEAERISFGEDGKSGKAADYAAAGELYKAIGIDGRCSDIWRKALRFASAMVTRKFDRKLRSDALDLLNYCVMFVVVYDEKLEGKK